MIKSEKLLGFSCVFAKMTDCLFLADVEHQLPWNGYFHVAYASVFHKRRKIAFPKEFSVSYIREVMCSSLQFEGLVLHLYEEGTKPTVISVYDDYMESKCKMVILLYDFYYLEVYCKDSSVLQRLISQAKDIPNVSLELKFEGCDPRDSMYV